LAEDEQAHLPRIDKFLREPALLVWGSKGVARRQAGERARTLQVSSDWSVGD
jgi:hypothetical protein